MSRLRQANGDDYPEAASKHLQDASVLLSGERFDGVAYLSGYVVECTIKTLIQVETGQGSPSHDLVHLRDILGLLATRAGARTGRFYIPVATLLRDAEVLGWEPGIRYHGPETDPSSAETWWQEASDVYSLVIGGLTLDGVIACNT